MSELQELIKRIKVSSVSLESYIYYDKSNGKIHKISTKNIPDDEYSIFPISNEEVKPILTGEKRTDEFVIFYDVSAKQVRLKEIAYEDNHKTASTMCYQLPIIKNQHDGHFSLTRVYEGMNVYFLDNTCDYDKGQCVWYNNNVYKLLTEVNNNNEFDETEHEVIVPDVFITDLPTQSHNVEKIKMQKEYIGVHVDVWYDELEHFAGQHVWVNDNVYRLIEDQDQNTEFDKDNTELLVSNVKLYADKNEYLETYTTPVPGDQLLINNSIYRVVFQPQEFDKDKNSIFFYNSPDTLIYYNNQTCLEVNLKDIYEGVDYRPISLNLYESKELKNGQLILSGKQIYQIETDKEYDIIVQQNTVTKTWSMMLNPYTKKFLLSSGYSPEEVLYFSITEKYDPNILYRSLEFKISELLADTTKEIPFIYDNENNDGDVSIYTAKYFDSYAHEVI